MGKSGPDITPTPAPTIPVDPALEGEQAKANNDQMKALRVQVQGDTASIMARYGTRLALAAGTPATPTVPGV